MAERVVEEHVVHSGGGSSGALLAVAVILLIAVLFLVLYFSGVFNFNKKRDINIDVDVNKPGVVLVVR